MREGDVVGQHRITFRRNDEELVVRSDLEIEVKLLLFTAYRYEQTRSEVWRGRQLVGLASVAANDGGMLYDIKGRAEGAAGHLA